MNDDLTAFVEDLQSTGFFEKDVPVILTRAPGRLDVMGGIADYSGSLVLQRTIAEATFVAIQRNDQPLLNVVSLGYEPESIPRVFALPLTSLFSEGEPIGYDAAHMIFQNPEDRWAAYVIGVFVVLMRERGAKFPDGSRILISSSVPEGKGVASSAALEVAVMQAVSTAFEIKISPKEMALLCQMVENRIAGAPCGIMDQMTSACGDTDSLLALVCQPAAVMPMVRIPEEIAFWGMDSGERHAVSGSDYVTVRTAAFMGYRIISRSCGNDFGGYLANLSPGQFAREFASQLPERMTGADFLELYTETGDAVTVVKPTQTYPIRQATAHPIFENDRVHEFQKLLLARAGLPQREALGALMFQSHESYSACGLGSSGTDLIVRLVREAGADSGVYGARITGGGSGGTVAIVGHVDAYSTIAEIGRKHRDATGHSPYVFSGSSPGAAGFGSRTIQL